MIAAMSARTLFTNGTFHESASGETLPVVDPATGAVTGAIAAGGAADVDRAVRSATTAFDGAWGALAAADRGRVLRRVSDAIAADAERLATIESTDTGKPISQARADVAAAVRYFEFFSGAADKLHGETIPYLPGYAVQVLRVPAGVTGHIIPWNYPTQMFARSLAPSLAVGNTTVIKPSEDASQSVVALAEIAANAGVPPGAINVVTGLGEIAGDALARHPGVDLIDFIGSPEAGTLVQSAAAEHHARVILELGGKSAQIVFADADLDAAVPAIVRAIVQNGGQTCSAGSRVLIEASAFDRVTARIADAFARLRVGLPPADPDVGPLINAAQFARVRGFVERARRDEVRVAASSTLPGDLPAGGFYVAPVVFGPVHEQHELARDEVFGPVLSAIPFADETRRDPHRERDGVRIGRRRVDRERRTADARRARPARRPGLRQLLRRGRRRRAAVRRVQEERPRPRERLRRDARVQHAADDRAEVRVSVRDGTLTGKVAIVTGGGSGFGAEIASKLAEDGATVTIVDVDEHAGRRTAAAIAARFAARATFAHADVTRRDDVAAVVRRTVDAHGGLDVYVNNAGITHRNRPMLEVDEAWFDRIFAVNVKALYLSALEVVPVLRARGGGAMIAIASTAGIRPRPGLTVYNASKAAAIGISKSMAVEFAPDNIRVNAICPVAGDTPLLAEFMGGDTPELRAKFAASVPLGRLSQPRDIANAVAFLASDDAAFITGVALEVDGGRCI